MLSSPRRPSRTIRIFSSVRIMLARRPSDVLNNLLSWFLRWSGLLSHLRSCERYDEPETLPYSIHPVCPMRADGGQAEIPRASWKAGVVGRHPIRFLSAPDGH